MELSHANFRCDWCAIVFPRRHLIGRKPLYCRSTCRQRAYEARRRAALQHSFPALPPKPIASKLPKPVPRHDIGLSATTIHSLRGAGSPDADGRRPTRCGTYARPQVGHFGEYSNPFKRKLCKACVSLETRYPPVARADPLRDAAHFADLLEHIQGSFLLDLDVPLRAAVARALAHLPSRLS